jgi:hypothetical protein
MTTSAQKFMQLKFCGGVDSGGGGVCLEKVLT